MTIEHISINTANLDTSVAFYREIIGLEITSDFRETAGMPIVFLADQKGGTSIELIQNAENVYHGSGISIGFHVDNIEASHSEIKKKGLKPSPIISPNPNISFFFVKDPNGVSIQFI